MPMLLAVLAAALSQDPQPAPAAAEPMVEAVEVTAAARVRGDMKTGLLTYAPAFFTVARPSTALDMIAWLPGFALEDTRDVRGLEGATGNVLIDGKPPTSKTDTLGDVLRRIPAEQVARVELIVGGAPGINMHGRNMVANVILKPVGEAPRRVITLNGYADKRGRASPGFEITSKDRWGERTLEAGMEYGRNIAIFPGFGYGDYTRRDAGGVRVFAADSDLAVGGPYLTGNAAYEASLAGGRFRINGFSKLYDNRFSDRSRLTPGPGEIRVTDDTAYRQRELGLRWERGFGRRTLELQALRRANRLDSDVDIQRPPTPSTFRSRSTEGESVLRAVLRWKPDEALSVEGFAEAALNTVDTASRLGGAAVVLPSGEVAVRETRSESGGTLSWKPGPKFSLDLAMKVETSNLEASGNVSARRDFVYAKPRAAVAWSPDARTQVRLRLEHVVDQVPFGAFLTGADSNTGLLRSGNVNILPSRQWVAEAVVQRGLLSGGDLSLTLRRKALRATLDPVAVAGPTGLFLAVGNLGDGEQTDAVAAFTLPLKAFGLTGAMIKGEASLADAKVPDPVTGVRRPLSGEPVRQVELHFTQDFPVSRLNWGVDAYYRGPSTFYQPFGIDSLKSWLHADLFVERRFGAATSLRLELRNLPGARVRQTVDLFQGLRNASPLIYRDERNLTNGPILYLRLRRTVS